MTLLDPPMTTHAGLVPLQTLLELDRIARLLIPLLGDGATVPSARVLKTATEKRVVIEYEAMASSGVRRVLIGKAYIDAARAQRSHDALMQLHAHTHAGWMVPRPVGVIPELAMSLHERAHGDSSDRVRGARRVAAMRAAGAWLATLHRLDVRLPKTVDMASELRKIDEWSQLVGGAHPRFATTCSQLARRLRTAAAALPPVDPRPIHKDFHYQHVLIGEAGVTAVDLDEVRQGDPELDVEHFVAYLGLLAIRERSSPAALEHAFRGGYGDLPGPSTGERRRFYRAHAGLKIAKQLTRGSGPTPAPSRGDLEAQLDAVLRAALCAID